MNYPENMAQVGPYAAEDNPEVAHDIQVCKDISTILDNTAEVISKMLESVNNLSDLEVCGYPEEIRNMAKCILRYDIGFTLARKP